MVQVHLEHDRLRTPGWSPPDVENPLTNEEHFGLVAMEPGERPAAVIDGDRTEWTNNGSQVIFEGHEGVREVRAVNDEAFLYLNVVLDEKNSLDRGLAIGFDVL